jgi:hypothetical protein
VHTENATSQAVLYSKEAITAEELAGTG